MRILLRASSAAYRAACTPGLTGFGHGNSGNILFAQSVFKSLCNSTNVIDVDEYKPDFATAGEINERYDALVLPLANAFRPAFEPQLRQYTSLIRELKIPCVVVGVGAQADLTLAALQGSPIDDAVKEFAAAVLDRSPAIGARGELTCAYLNRLGFSAVTVIGCPSLFLNGANLEICKLTEGLSDESKIALNHTPGVGTVVSDAIRGVLRNYRNSVIVAQEQAGVQQWAQLAGADRVRHFRHVPDWIAFMRTRNFSLGTRIHGNIAALLAGIPALVIAHDSRTLELARYHRIPHVLEHVIRQSTSIAELYESTDCGAANASAPGLFRRYAAFLEKSGLDHGLDDPLNAARFDRSLKASTAADGASSNGSF